MIEKENYDGFLLYLALLAFVGGAIAGGWFVSHFGTALAAAGW